MRQCVQFFKDHVGANITETFVIDKDFQEWDVLEEIYPEAKVSKITTAPWVTNQN